ncbi:DUF45 domain-containing protein [Chitinispirillales bacterium ANBcel5]|uniref:YgjP-like metallopeptidase domain-containing protein n=1 Tax=Cellulosispirillum alkaliphilum TaxID=3039283 RepID=UPI002A522ECA|nr:DUF45 domain-containing protein [Chitinispirillales bacterium ANBcel5]
MKQSDRHRLDERNHVEKPLLRQLHGLGSVIKSKRQWVYEKTRHAQMYALAHPPGKELVNGQSALYPGRQYQIEVVQNSSEEVRFEQRFLVPERLSAERKKVLQKWKR